MDGCREGRMSATACVAIAVGVAALLYVGSFIGIVADLSRHHSWIDDGRSHLSNAQAYFIEDVFEAVYRPLIWTYNEWWLQPAATTNVHRRF